MLKTWEVTSEIDRLNYTGWNLCYLIFSEFIHQSLRFSNYESKDNENEIEPQVYYCLGLFDPRLRRKVGISKF